MTPLDEINDLNFDKEVIADPGTFLLAFGAKWCAPCRRLDPLLQRLRQEEPLRLRVAKLDIDEAPLTTQKYRVRGAPTLIVFRSGVEVNRLLGLPSERKLRELLSS